ncbi:hypothetical protein SAMN06265375_1101 [Muriicola jejuensis]|uniref:DUF304 domain-containing protein n=1 Tax=Muriicola jejuensis TaxID=504488 RepID=A0A6P0UGM6_9FLAO|nr:hypothetical protein [Muriicola jejuensis]NER11782.1 hypothetical protein [Muriicola jejuensis]SMP26693.1 hypothetical protein SAMN06265375_1101 [Muriicola jejuensis]
MEILFQNKKSIDKSDIPFQFGLIFLFLVGSYLLSRIRYINKEVSATTYWIMGIGLFFLFTYLIFSAKTVKSIYKDSSSGKLKFVIQRQLKKDLIKELSISNLRTDLKKEATRGGAKYILKLSDGNNSLKIKTSQKGITKKDLDNILEKIENTTHNNGYNPSLS